jgi:hypothetical protein
MDLLEMNATILKLSTATLDKLPSNIEQPVYDRAKIKAGIVHLGIGAFHRAHQAVYTDDMLQAGAKGLGHYWCFTAQR